MSATIFTYRNILKAYLDCRKKKRQTLSALGFECQLEQNLAALTEALKNRTYQPQRSVYFIVDQPKLREIFASEFVDRITHHLLINEVEKIWDPDIFITDSYACRKNKGHHYGMRRMSRFIQQYDYYGQFDVANFFSTLDRGIMFKLFAQVIKTQPKPQFWIDDILWLGQIIISIDPTKDYFYKGRPGLRLRIPPQKSLFDQASGVGMPIGNLSSQFLANVYLHELDTFAVKTLKIPGYARYVDDFVLLSDCKDEIKAARDQIRSFLQKHLALTLHPKKQQIQPTHRGIAFVGYYIKPTGVTVRRNVVKTLKSRLYIYQQQPVQSNLQPLMATLNSYYGHLRQARTYRLRQHLFWHHLRPADRQRLLMVGSWNSFRVITQSSKRKGQRR